jgi:hypothetical protein
MAFGAALGRLLVDHGRTLSSPLLFGHRPIADDVSAEDVIDVLHVAPVLGISVLQPEHAARWIWWTVLDVVNDNRLLRTSENLHCIVVIAVGALIERTLNASHLMAGRPPPVRKGPTPGGAVGWGNHARSMGELEEAFPGV